MNISLIRKMGVGFISAVIIGSTSIAGTAHARAAPSLTTVLSFFATSLADAAGKEPGKNIISKVFGSASSNPIDYRRSIEGAAREIRRVVPQGFDEQNLKVAGDAMHAAQVHYLAYSNAKDPKFRKAELRDARSKSVDSYGSFANMQSSGLPGYMAAMNINIATLTASKELSTLSVELQGGIHYTASTLINFKNGVESTYTRCIMEDFSYGPGGGGGYVRYRKGGAKGPVIFSQYARARPGDWSKPAEDACKAHRKNSVNKLLNIQPMVEVRRALTQWRALCNTLNCGSGNVERDVDENVLIEQLLTESNNRQKK